MLIPMIFILVSFIYYSNVYSLEFQTRDLYLLFECLFPSISNMCPLFTNRIYIPLKIKQVPII